MVFIFLCLYPGVSKKKGEKIISCYPILRSLSGIHFYDNLYIFACFLLLESFCIKPTRNVIFLISGSKV